MRLGVEEPHKNLIYAIVHLTIAFYLIKHKIGITSYLSLLTLRILLEYDLKRLKSIRNPPIRSFVNFRLGKGIRLASQNYNVNTLHDFCIWPNQIFSEISRILLCSICM